MERAVDWLGQEYGIGDYMVYSTSYSKSSAQTMLVRVTEFITTLKNGEPMDRHYAPDGFHVKAEVIEPKFSRSGGYFASLCNETLIKLPCNLTKVNYSE